MTVGFSASLMNTFLDTNFDDLFVQIHTADPGASGTTAVAAGDNTRKAYVTSGATAGSKTTTGSTGPWTNGGTSESISHISIHTLVTAGTFRASAAITGGAQAWVSTNTLTLTSMTIAFTPIAA